MLQERKQNLASTWDRIWEGSRAVAKSTRDGSTRDGSTRDGTRVTRKVSRTNKGEIGRSSKGDIGRSREGLSASKGKVSRRSKKAGGAEVGRATEGKASTAKGKA